MRIGIDARMYGKNTRGIGRYLAELIKSLEKLDTENQYYIFLYKNNFDEYQPENNNFHKVLAPWHWYSLAEQWHMPHLLKKYNLDLVHFPHFNVPYFFTGNYVVTIHDLILWFDSQKPATTLGPLLYNLKKIAYKFLLKRILKKSKKIIVPTNYTKKDILKINPDIDNKIKVIYEGVNRNIFSKEVDNQSVKDKYNINNKYCLYVGSFYPHKKIDFLIENWSQVYDKYGYQLVLAGKKDEFQKKLAQQVNKLSLNDKVLFLGFVPDEDLSVLYEGAESFIFPSRYEGFGLPPLEALSKHCPVLSSNRTCLTEVLQNKVVYFDYDSQSLLKAINNIPEAKNKVKYIDEWLEQYTWLKMARNILEIYIESQN